MRFMFILILGREIAIALESCLDAIYMVLSHRFKLASVAILGLVVLVGVTDLPKRAIAAAYKQSAYTNFNTPFYQELNAKLWLLKYDPQPAGAFGMPFIDVRSKKQITQEAIQLKKIAKKFVKDNPDFVNFLYASYKTTDELAYQTKQKMDLIKLTKTETGFTYRFQSGGGCFVNEYSGSLIMNGNVVTGESMEMRTRGTPC